MLINERPAVTAARKTVSASAIQGFSRLFVLAAFFLATPYLAMTARADSWVPLHIIDVQSRALDANPRFGSASRTLLRTKSGGSLIHAAFSPSWDMRSHEDRLGAHFHRWREWAYILQGDFVIHEPINTTQQNPPAYRFIEGTWLDRPAYSLHGGSWETGGIRSQNPVVMLLFEEGDGSVVTVGEDGDHFKPDFPAEKPDPYLPDWPEDQDFPRAWIVDSAQTMEWERDPEMPGRFIKWLSDNVTGGLRARLVKAPPGWEAPSGTPLTYYAQGHVLRYVLHGTMNVWQFDGDGAGTAVPVGADTLVHQPPRSIWGYGDGPVTPEGAVWLEVVYAGDLEQGHGPIQDPIALQ